MKKVAIAKQLNVSCCAAAHSWLHDKVQGMNMDEPPSQAEVATQTRNHFVMFDSVFLIAEAYYMGFCNIYTYVKICLVYFGIWYGFIIYTRAYFLV